MWEEMAESMAQLLILMFWAAIISMAIGGSLWLRSSEQTTGSN
jgi:hypothetical protein